MDFFSSIGKFFGDVGKAIGGAIQSIGQAVSSVAGVIKDVAGAVSDFIQNNPIGQFLTAIPGVGGLISTIGSVAGTVRDVAGTVQNFANQAADFGKVLGGSVANGVSPTGLGSAAVVAEQLHHTRDLARFAQGVGHSVRQPHANPASRSMARLASINYGQIFAQRQAQLMRAA
jgi:phage-related protein